MNTSDLSNIINYGQKQLTNEMIASDLRMIPNELNVLISVLAIVMVLVFGFVCFIIFKDEKKQRKKIIVLILNIMIVLITAIFSGKKILKNMAIEYSLQNNCFEVVTDKVAKTETVWTDSDIKKDNRKHYIYLENNGKHFLNSSSYYSISKGDLIYIVLVKGKSGKTYNTNLIYLTSEYKYVE